MNRLILPVCFFSASVLAAEPLKLSRADYADRAHAAWVAQIAGVYLGFPHEHRTASVEWQTIEADLTSFAGRDVTLRLYQNLLTNNRLRPVSAAHWKSISLK